MPDFSALPPLLIHFGLTALFSFVIGLEFHSYRRLNRRDLGFGTTRTFTLIGIFGFGLYALDSRGILFVVGLLILSVFLLAYYRLRARAFSYSLITPMVALLTYLVGGAAQTLPSWFLVLFVVTILLLLGEKPGIRRFSDAFRNNEMVTIAKFLIMAGVVLPLLPSRQMAPPYVTVTYYQLWLTVLAVSSLSYLAYLAQTYFFKEKSLLLTGILGGLYSSTAATVVIAGRVREGGESGSASPALIMATAMMYLRLLALVSLLGGVGAAGSLLAPFLSFVAASAVVASILYRRQAGALAGQDPKPPQHPLEFRAASLFALLFVAFSAITYFVVSYSGTGGLHTLAVAVGLTDIDPFVLALLAGKFHVSTNAIVSAIVVASGSNNLLKAGYALVLGRDPSVRPAAIWLILLFLSSVAYAGWF